MGKKEKRFTMRFDEETINILEKNVPKGMNKSDFIRNAVIHYVNSIKNEKEDSLIISTKSLEKLIDNSSYLKNINSNIELLAKSLSLEKLTFLSSVESAKEDNKDNNHESVEANKEMPDEPESEQRKSIADSLDDLYKDYIN